MALRAGMCRWPIGDQHDFKRFRFCGCACSLETNYCETHKKLASAPNRPKSIPVAGNSLMSTIKTA
ncbi:GcrA family cell cycle regulator [Methylocystis echinoides]|uniref:GcrA family cell cycle regulator n=1 Tax=Methylocystis echinoides TaxID=29468 RepID=UPI003430B6FD